jgi:hypothetical protein
MNDTKLAPLPESPATQLFAPAGLDVWTAPTAAFTKIAEAQNYHTGPYDFRADAYRYCVAS